MLLSACTENQRARQFGGTETVNLPEGQAFVNATWKDHDLWIITTDRNPLDTVKRTYRFSEKSSYGLMEGTIVINEK